MAKEPDAETDKMKVFVKLSGSDIYRAIKQYLKTNEADLMTKVDQQFEAFIKSRMESLFSRRAVLLQIDAIVKEYLEKYVEKLAKSTVLKSSMLEDIVKARVDQKLNEILAKAIASSSK